MEPAKSSEGTAMVPQDQKPKPDLSKVYDVVIDDIGSEGDGIAHIDGLVVFVKGAKKGDNARIRIVRAFKSSALGMIVRDPPVPDVVAGKEYEVTLDYNSVGKYGEAMVKVGNATVYVQNAEKDGPQTIVVKAVKVNDLTGHVTAVAKVKGAERHPRAPMEEVTPGREYEVSISEQSDRGDGIARIGGLVVFVEGIDKPGSYKIVIDNVRDRFATAHVAGAERRKATYRKGDRGRRGSPDEPIIQQPKVEVGKEYDVTIGAERGKLGDAMVRIGTMTVFVKKAVTGWHKIVIRAINTSEKTGKSAAIAEMVEQEGPRETRYALFSCQNCSAKGIPLGSPCPNDPSHALVPVIDMTVPVIGYFSPRRRQRAYVEEEPARAFHMRRKAPVAFTIPTAKPASQAPEVTNGTPLGYKADLSVDIRMGSLINAEYAGARAFLRMPTVPIAYMMEHKLRSSGFQVRRDNNTLVVPNDPAILKSVGERRLRASGAEVFQTEVKGDSYVVHAVHSEIALSMATRYASEGVSNNGPILMLPKDKRLLERVLLEQAAPVVLSEREKIDVIKTEMDKYWTVHQTDHYPKAEITKVSALAQSNATIEGIVTDADEPKEITLKKDGGPLARYATAYTVVADKTGLVLVKGDVAKRGDKVELEGKLVSETDVSGTRMVFEKATVRSDKRDVTPIGALATGRKVQKTDADGTVKTVTEHRMHIAGVAEGHITTRTEMPSYWKAGDRATVRTVVLSDGSGKVALDLWGAQATLLQKGDRIRVSGRLGVRNDAPIFRCNEILVFQ